MKIKAEAKIRQYIVETGKVPECITVSREEFADLYVFGDLTVAVERVDGQRDYEFMGVIVKPDNSEPVNPLPAGWSAVSYGDNFKITRHNSRTSFSSTLLMKNSSNLEQQLLHALLDKVLL